MEKCGLLPSSKYHEPFLWVELPSPEKIEEYPILQKESYLSDHKDPLSQDLFLLFEIEHPLQRFDSRLIGIDNPP
jgi:hypothetical protein